MEQNSPLRSLRVQSNYMSYVNRVPTPPRILVPPPYFDDTMHSMQNSIPSFLETGNPSSEALREALGGYEPTSQSKQWEYGDRHQAQPILPYLWLGPMTVTKEREWLETTGITMVLAVRGELKKLFDLALQRATNSGLEAQYIDGPDESSLIKAFPTATTLIKNHIIRMNQAGKASKVLVFCESGNDRSASVVAAFAMEVHTDVDYIKAIQLCQSQRFCCSFKDESKSTLQAYWDILCAQRGVASVSALQQLSVLPKKRRHEMEDEDMDGLQDAEKFHRPGCSPFID